MGGLSRMQLCLSAFTKEFMKRTSSALVHTQVLNDDSNNLKESISNECIRNVKTNNEQILELNGAQLDESLDPAIAI